MANEISKKEFLKRYLENEESSRKRKKKPKLAKPKANIPCLKIVNEDIDIKSMSFGEKADDEEDDEAPVVAEVIDERPVEIKLKELYDSSRWKKIDSSEHLQSTESYEKNIKNRRHDSDDDLSPLREQKKPENVDVSSQSHKQNKKRHDSDSDFSPPRNLMQSRSKHKSDDDIPSIQSHKQSKNKYNSDSDLSPSRNYKQSRNRHNYNSDSSFQGNKKQNRHNSDSDLSPPRNQKQIRNKHNSNSGSSSQQNRSNSDSDLSPPRNHKVSSNKNLADQQKVSSQDKNLKKQKHYSDDDLSPVREQKKHKYRHDSDSDLSPSSSHNHSSAKGKNKLDKTLSGLKAGLQNSKSLQEEVQALRNREKSQLNMLGDEISGRNAETIIRDRKTGKKRDLNKEQEIKNEEDKKNKEFLQKYEKWGKGTETRDEHIEKLKDEMHEMSKPLARYEDDADLDERLKSIIHDDDPMSAYMKKKKQKEEGVSKFPVYTGPAAPVNRFGIKPGYRWDGVDRSNGFEKKYFEKINHSKAVKDEAYLWSVQDM